MSNIGKQCQAVICFSKAPDLISQPFQFLHENFWPQKMSAIPQPPASGRPISAISYRAIISESQVQTHGNRGDCPPEHWQNVPDEKDTTPEVGNK